MGDEDEDDHWRNVMRTFLFYEDFVAFDLGRRQDHINKLPQAYSDRLPNSTFEKFGALHHASKSNQMMFEDMVHFQSSSAFHTNSNVSAPSKQGNPIHISQQHRNIAVLHSMYREWSHEGAAERRSTFQLLVDELKLRLPVTKENACKQKVLVPGCGLGRLPLDIASAGYACQGNEYSAFMAIASNFILNAGSEAGQYRIYPWISNVSNIAAVQDSLQGVDVPDVAAGDALDAFVPPETVTETEGEGEGATTTAGVERAQTCLASRFEPLVPARWRDRLAQQKQQQQHQQEQEEQQLQQQLQQQQARSTFPRFSMATGDFVEIYTNLKAEQHLPQLGRRCVDGSTGVVFTDSSLATDSGAAQWDAVVTCFFLDTAPVVLEYVEAIERILKPGGVWVNLGPLLYHWAAAADAAGEDSSDARYAQSVELSYEELKEVIQGYGLEFLEERWQDCTYSRCDSAMMWTTYRTVLFTVRKPVVLCKSCP